MAALFTIVGAILIISALIDVFHTLFHPASHGAMSDWIAETVWKSFRRTARHFPRALTFAGPVSAVCIIVNWIGLTIFGFGLVFLFYPTPTAFSPSHFWMSIANSTDVLSTISTGQGMVAPWIRMIAGLEAMIGFGIVTASISWLLSIYPIVEARRSLAHQATLLHASEKMSGLDLLRDGVDDAPAILMSIAHDLSVLRNQMAQFPISYYFYVGERRTTLAGILPYLAELADRSLKNDVPVQLRIPGIMLRGAVEDFSIHAG